MDGRRLRYDAFIAYSHAQRSAHIAETLQTGLQRFARTWYRGRAARVFRDTTDLAASPGLWSDIQSALAQSRWFILIASPEAAGAPWVRREVDWWLTNRSTEQLIIVVADGVLRWDDARHRLDPLSTAVPPQLLDAYPEEPLWVDLAAFGAGGEAFSPASMDHAVASISARMRGIPLDAVIGEHVRQQRRTRRIVALVMSLLVLLAGGATAASIVAIRQRDEAVAAADRAASRTLILQSTSLRTAQIDRALLTGIAAAALDAGPRARANLIASLAGGRYAGTLPGPASGVTTTRFAPAGRTAVTTHANGEARLWDVSDPAHARLLSTITDTGPLYTSAWRPDGRLLALGGQDKTVSLWDVADVARPSLVSRLPAHWGEVRAVTFDLSGERLFTGGNNIYGVADEGVRVWDVRVPERPAQVALLPITSFILDVTVAPQGGMVAVGGTGGTWLWRLEDDHPTKVAEIDAHTDSVYAAAFTPDGQVMVTCSQDRTVLIWDVSQPETPRQMASLPEFPKPVLVCEISGDARLLALGVGDGTISMWSLADPARPTEVARLPGHADIVDAIAFSADATLLMSGAGDGRTLVWTTVDTSAPVRRSTVQVGVGPIWSMALGPDDATLAVNVEPVTSRGLREGSVRLYQLPGTSPGALLADLRPSTRGNSLSLSPDGRTLLTVNHEAGASYLWDVADPLRPGRIGTLEVADLSDVAWSPGGNILLLNRRRAGGVGAATLWDVSDRSRPVLLSTEGFGDITITAVAMSQDGKTVALTTGSLAESVTLWDVTDPATPTAIGGLKGGHPAVIRSVAFSPRGDVLATGSNDQTVAIWSVPGGERRSVLDGHELAVNTVAFSDDATMIVALDDSGTLTLWDVADPSLAVKLHTIPAAGDDATSFALGRDGRRVIVGRDSGAVEVWDIGRIHDIVTDPVRVACELTGRGLTETEWGQHTPERPYRPTC